MLPTLPVWYPLPTRHFSASTHIIAHCGYCVIRSAASEVRTTTPFSFFFHFCRPCSYLVSAARATKPLPRPFAFACPFIYFHTQCRRSDHSRVTSAAPVQAAWGRRMQALCRTGEWWWAHGQRMYGACTLYGYMPRIQHGQQQSTDVVCIHP